MAYTNKSLKLTIVGDSAVGKTCICNMNTIQGHLKSMHPTIFDNDEENIMVDGDHHRVALFDTAGAQDYDSLRPWSYPETECIILCYSISCRDSYRNIVEKWFPEVKQYMPTAPIILVGNKIDLRKDSYGDFVTTEEGTTLKKKIRASALVECSAMTGENLREVFEEAVRCAVGERPEASGSCSLL